MDIFHAQPDMRPRWRKWIKRLGIGICVSILILTLFWNANISAPKRAESIIVHVTPGESLPKLALKLKEADVVRSEVTLQSMISFLNADRQIPSGDYVFKPGVSAYRVAVMLARGIHGVNPVKVTFPEGITNAQMANILSAKLSNFDAGAFLELTKNKQGYLFPETYFMFPLTTPSEAIRMMENIFEKKTDSLFTNIPKGYTEDDMVIFASLVQGEAAGSKDIDIVADILWKRLERGMMLQIDVAPETYKTKGLPKESIGNPGIEAIRAVLSPSETPYLFYLHDKSGMIHFASTFEEHKKNISKYLR